MKFWKFINKAENEPVELYIEGDIVDNEDVWIYEWFGEEATAPNAFKEELSEFTGRDITVWIDSYGGSVFAGASIYNALKEHNGKVTVKIDGKAMSAASVIAMAGDEILVSPVAIMMIHNPLTGIYGDMHDLRKVADVLDEVKESIINAYVIKTNLSREKISEMMDEETYMSAATAVKYGFADGTLYQDEPSLSVANDFNFNRLAIVNSTNESIRRVLETENLKKQTAEKEKLLMELDFI